MDLSQCRDGMAIFHSSRAHMSTPAVELAGAQRYCSQWIGEAVIVQAKLSVILRRLHIQQHILNLGNWLEATAFIKARVP